MENIEEVREALCDVRRAHRILYAYQKRMMDIIRYIAKKLDFPVIEGYKHFSNTPSKKIYSGTWAWDYIYTYLFQYYLGEKETDDRNTEFAISIFQFSDTGFFDKENSTRTNLSTFETEEYSESKLVFMLEVKPKESPWWWKVDDIINKKEYASKNHTSTILKKGESTVLIYSVPIEKLLDEKSALNMLKEFCSFCKENSILELSLH